MDIGTYQPKLKLSDSYEDNWVTLLPVIVNILSLYGGILSLLRHLRTRRWVMVAGIIILVNFLYLIVLYATTPILLLLQPFTKLMWEIWDNDDPPSCYFHVEIPR